MYAYVDETGNTGANIFDKDQPLFITAALMTRADFDVIHQPEMQTIAARVGETTLHANRLGEARVEECAGDLLRLFERSDARFFVSRIEKRYLATAKLVDTLLDSEENKGVAWHIYNLRPLRLLMVFKVGSILEEETVREFWAAILDTNEQCAYACFIESLQDLSQNVERLPDARSRQIIGEAIEWAIKNPGSIQLHTNSRAARTGHLPNLAVFPNLLEGIEKCSRFWDQEVREIVHDRQSEFQRTLQEWHEVFSHAPPDVITWTLGEQYVLRRVPGSKFRISSSDDSPGLQAVDVVIWLFKRVLENKGTAPNSAALMSYVFQHGYQNDMSFEAVGEWLESYFAALSSKQFTEEDAGRARDMLSFAEERRKQAMLDYAERKLQESADRFSNGL